MGATVRCSTRSRGTNLTTTTVSPTSAALAHRQSVVALVIGVHYHLDGFLQKLKHWRVLDGRLLHSFLRDQLLLLLHDCHDFLPDRRHRDILKRTVSADVNPRIAEQKDHSFWSFFGSSEGFSTPSPTSPLGLLHCPCTDTADASSHHRDGKASLHRH